MFRHRRLAPLLVIVLILFAFAATTAAQEPADPATVNVFLVEPSVPAGGTILVNVNANLNSVDGTSYFCFYIPQAGAVAAATFPATIDLDYFNGLTQTSATFTQTTQGSGEPVCPTRTGQNSGLYKATGLPVTDEAYDGNFNLNIAGSATPGTYSWSLLLEEPSGNPDILSDAHTILGPTAVSVSGIGFSPVSTPLILLVLFFALSLTSLFVMRRLALETRR